MTGTRTKSSRRAFFLKGGAALGTGVATTVGASALMPGNPAPPGNPALLDEQLKQLRSQLGALQDREAIQQVHLAFMRLIESRNYEAAAELFDDQAHVHLCGTSATGKPAILEMFVAKYGQQTAGIVHTAYRGNTSQQSDSLTLSDDRRQATATFHTEAQLCVPLQVDCTAAEMARLQGHVADRRWETGRFEARYVKTRGQWKMASLRYVA